jgi:hypothetical protein
MGIEEIDISILCPACICIRAGQVRHLLRAVLLINEKIVVVLKATKVTSCL